MELGTKGNTAGKILENQNVLKRSQEANFEQYLNRQKADHSHVFLQESTPEEWIVLLQIHRNQGWIKLHFFSFCEPKN